MRTRTLSVLAAAAALQAVSLAAPPTPTPAPTLPPTSLPVKLHSWTGDFDGMLARREIRVLVPYSKTFYFVVKGAPRGVAYETFKEFETWINKKHPPKVRNLKLHVVFVPVSRDRLFSGLVDGEGDIAVAGLTITSEREKTVDFTEPTASGVDEIAVTGPASPALSRLEDLSGKEVFVRKSSSYWESLMRLNERFRTDGKAPVALRPASEDLEDEDLLEMLNAGLVGIVVTDSYLPRLWGHIYPKIRAHPEIVLHSGGSFAWAIRRGSPGLKAELDPFVKTHRQGTAFGGTLIQRYVGSDKMIRSATSAESRQRFERTVALFRKYSATYGMDPLLMMAQGFQESGLNQEAKSPVGAVGVMQLMPKTGEDMKAGDIHEMEANIHAGVKYVRFMVEQYFAAEPMTDVNKILFAFASYNAGPGRIHQMRELARKRGLDSNVWFGNVAAVAAEKIGMETVTYVANIYKYYIAYKLITEHEEEKRNAREAVPTARVP